MSQFAQAFPDLHQTVTDAFPDLANAGVGEAYTSPARDAIRRAMRRNQDDWIVPHAPALAVSYPNGTVVADTMDNYLSNKNFYPTGVFAKLAMGHPIDFQWAVSEGIRKELERFRDRSAFDFGTFLHRAVLEPETWESVVIEPIASRAINEGCDTLINFWRSFVETDAVDPDSFDLTKLPGKKAYIEAMKTASGKTVISEKDHLILQALRNRWAVYADGAWLDIIHRAHREVSVYANDYMGLPMRVRPDGLLFENQIGINAVVSVKTTSAASMRQFMSQSAGFGYHIKEAAYQDIVSHVTGTPFAHTICVVFQTVEPFNVAVTLWNTSAIESGRAMFTDAAIEAQQLLKDGHYPGWNESADDSGVIDMDIPEWAYQNSNQ